MDGHVEWAVINRLKAMLDDPPPTRFNVTQTFALFSAVLLWTKNRGWVAGNGPAPLADGPDRSADEFRRILAGQSITDAPWLLTRRVPQRIEEDDIEPRAAEFVNGDFVNMSVEAFTKWLRDAIGHGDGRTITPLHKHNRPASDTWLSGFQVFFPETRGSNRILHLCLYEPDMRRIGSLLADGFCEALSRDPRYYGEDVATRILEAERVA